MSRSRENVLNELRSLSEIEIDIAKKLMDLDFEIENFGYLHKITSRRRSQNKLLALQKKKVGIK